jgi:hypothetical protein
MTLIFEKDRGKIDFDQNRFTWLQASLLSVGVKLNLRHLKRKVWILKMILQCQIFQKKMTEKFCHTWDGFEIMTHA